MTFTDIPVKLEQDFLVFVDVRRGEGAWLKAINVIENLPRTVNICLGYTRNPVDCLRVRR